MAESLSIMPLTSLTSLSLNGFLNLREKPLSGIFIASATYQKMKKITGNEDYPQYLKDGLLQALIDKFSNYMVKDGEIIDIDYFDIITDCDKPPF